MLSELSRACAVGTGCGVCREHLVFVFRYGGMDCLGEERCKLCAKA